MEFMYMPFDNGLVVNVISNILTIKEKKTQEEYIRIISTAWQEGDYIELLKLVQKLTPDLMALARDYLALNPSHHVIDVLYMVKDGDIYDTHCVNFKALAQWLVYHTDAYTMPEYFKACIDYEKLGQELHEGGQVYTENDASWWEGEYLQTENGVIGIIKS